MAENRHITERCIACPFGVAGDFFVRSEFRIVQIVVRLEEALANSAKVETIRSYSRWRGQLGLV
jgi:hypothetical protein